MKFAVLLLVACLSISLVAAEERDEEVVTVEEQGLSSRKLLSERYYKYCDPYDHYITCKGYGEYCGKLKYPVCKNVKDCKKEKVCVDHGYGYGYKKSKYCKKYGYKYNCYDKKECYKYACMKKKSYGGYGYKKKTYG